MWYRILVKDGLLAIAIVMTTLIGTQLATRSTFSPSPIEALNCCIQERFLDLENFGLRRIASHLYEFHPKNSDEEVAVATLKQRGWSLGLYVVGRDILESPNGKPEGDESDLHGSRRAINGPIRIADEPVPADLPGPSELREIGRSALAASTTSDQFKAPLGRWWVEARPVRANQEACLRCHVARSARRGPPQDTDSKARLKIGDALGAVLYVYARASK